MHGGGVFGCADGALDLERMGLSLRVDVDVDESNHQDLSRSDNQDLSTGRLAARWCAECPNPLSLMLVQDMQALDVAVLDQSYSTHTS